MAAIFFRQAYGDDMSSPIIAMTHGGNMSSPKILRMAGYFSHKTIGNHITFSRKKFPLHVVVAFVCYSDDISSRIHFFGDNVVAERAVSCSDMICEYDKPVVNSWEIFDKKVSHKK